jgi:hypothetical protein
MKRTTKNQPKTYNGFAIPILPDTDLGLAMLIAEDETGHTHPVAVVSTINEAKEVAESDLAGRMRDLHHGKTPICPYEYKVWARGIDGDYIIAAKFKA